MIYERDESNKINQITINGPIEIPLKLKVSIYFTIRRSKSVMTENLLYM